MNPQPVSLADELRKLAEWIQERKANALRLAEGKVGADKDGWLEDAEYYQRIEGALLAQHAVAEPQVETDGNIWSEVRRLQEIRLRSAVSVEAFSVDDIKFLLARIDQRDRAFKELLRQRPAHAAEQPKLTLVLTEEQVREALLTCVRDISKLQGLLREKHGKGFTIPCSTGKLRAANVLHLLTSPVAPPPQRKEKL